MKKKTEKKIKIKYSRLAGALLVLGVLALAVSGSFAAYTSFNSVKRVVSTGTQSDTMFSSNYLSLLNLNDEAYPAKRIPFSDTETGTFTVLVCNYVWGNESLYNPKKITYTVTAQILSMDGGSLPDDITGVKMNDSDFSASRVCTLANEVLDSSSAKRNNYKFEIPAALKNKIKIQMTAEPSDDDSKKAVNNQKLAAIFSFAEYKATKNWTGHFLDSTDRSPNDYDAFNYEISGNGAGTVTVTWDENSLQLSKWATNGKQKSGSYTFTVDDSTMAVQFQFYRNPEDTLIDTLIDTKNWADLEKLVTVTFKEAKKVDENVQK